MKNRAKDGNAGAYTGRSMLRVMLLALAFMLHASCFILSSAAAQQPKPAGTPATAAEAPRGPLTYDNFKLVHTRNVFDPDRRPVRPANSAPVTSGTRADYLALTGTLVEAEKTYAFFSGSRTDFNKVLTVGDKIASNTLTQITSMNIVVERDGKRTTVAVGQTVPLDGKSAPGAAPVNVAEAVTNGTAADNAASATGAPATTTAGNTGAGGNAPGTPPAAPGSKPPTGSKEEILRKMMERRQQELK